MLTNTLDILTTLPSKEYQESAKKEPLYSSLTDKEHISMLAAENRALCEEIQELQKVIDGFNAENKASQLDSATKCD